MFLENQFNMLQQMIFLSHFNLQKLTDLPNIEELTSAGLIDNGILIINIWNW